MENTFKLFKNQFSIDDKLISPHQYLKATNEMYIFMYLICGIVTIISNPNIFYKNPILHFIGYNNLCIVFDTYPANIFGLMINTVGTYLNWRYCFTKIQLNTLLFKNNLISSRYYYFNCITNVLSLISTISLNLIFLIPPTYNLIDFRNHSYPFVMNLLMRCYDRVIVYSNNLNELTLFEKIMLFIYPLITTIFSTFVILIINGHSFLEYWLIGCILDYSNLFFSAGFGILMRDKESFVQINDLSNTIKVIVVKKSEII